MLGAARELWKDASFRKVLKVFVAVKIILIIVAAGAQFIPQEYTNRQDRANFIINGWAQYDAAAYVDIAMNGYNQAFAEGRGNYGWFPLYPLLILIFGFLGPYEAGFLISNVLSIIAIGLIYMIVKEEFGPSIAYDTVLLMSFFPTAYFLNAVYTESLFLLETAAFFWFMGKGRYLEGSLAGFFAALTRTQGALLLLPAIIIYYMQRMKKDGKLGFDALWLLLIPAGTAVFMGYQFLVTGNALAQFQTHSEFQRHLSLPTDAIMNGISGLMQGIAASDISGTFYHSFNLFILVFFAGLLWICYKKLKPEYTVYFAVSLILPLLSARLEAISRFYLMIFPAFIALSLVSKERRPYLMMLYGVFAVLLILFTIRHANEDIFLSAIAPF
ncbi:MAG: glycosyltransferase family 39 protein [Candidatus Aenigmarchaeota archaeon]|nr:glycosyltransferase family 39 protein [Candidatus Aenigmarchaeota archaeon]